MNDYTTKRILIWGKTYPELSDKYEESVCTGGVFEDGTPVRLYPIPFRYLKGNQQFKKYQWITADVKRDHTDSRRCESHRVMPATIRLEEWVDSKNYWRERRQYLFKDRSWHFDSMDALNNANNSSQHSIAVMRPSEILEVEKETRPSEHRVKFEQKKKAILERHEQEEMFESISEVKAIDFIEERVKVKWRCTDEGCGSSASHKLHEMQVMDWEVCELARRKGINHAWQAVADICDLDEYDLRLFLSTLKIHPNRFTIAGFWYPKIDTNVQTSLDFGD